MLTRAISGLVFVLLVVVSLLGGFTLALLFFALVSILGTIEFYKLASSFSNPYKWNGAMFSATIILTSGVLAYNPKAIVVLVALVIFLGRFVVRLLKSKSKTAIVDISVTISGALYLAIPFVSLLFIGIISSFDPEQFDWRLPLSIFILTWVNDTGAYLSGRTFGKTKLFERISPNKTWEGSIGGLIFTVFGSAVLFHFWPSFTLVIWAGAAVLISIFANLGDLMESAFKRNAGVKDSGKIMPGHGGILDRFDAVLLTAPIVFGYFLAIIAFY